MSDEREPTPRRAGSMAAGSFWKWFERLGPLVMLIALFVGFSLASDTFFTVNSLKLILIQASILVICALGMTMIIISGGLDLSVAGIVVLSSVIGAMGWRDAGSVPLVVAGALGTGVLAGALNGFLIAGLRMNPFIATLGMMAVTRGIAKAVTNNGKVYLRHETPVLDEQGEPVLDDWGEPLGDVEKWNPDLLVSQPTSEPWASIGLPPGVFIALGLVLVMIVLMRFTVFGRHIYAIGSNEEAARFCGIRVDAGKMAIYTLAGLLFGIAGIMQMSFDNVGNSTSIEGFELDVIAAVIIGGASLTGGTGTVLGSVIGAFILVVLKNGFSQAGVPSKVEMLIKGAIIIAAALLDMLRQGRLKLPFRR